ncbi:HD domain-containing protein [Serpentinicella sp. ANB-PHB4]|uniref:HD domain-containing protein n=1 Tax=Serpentinicella sp. ANB-PHB4 TaxID=3074076 RepID=UPI00286746D9|nr:HD domain-containing protein [Serpentinicella sp. ANB-PHB4]MDR5658713.1 HD domain-containing protein [Serpentinicella sp. ANB-PHB4]
MNFEHLEKQMKFIIEIDKLKSIYRQTLLIDQSRHEGDADHSWHLAMMAMTLKEHANFEHIDILKVIKMVLIHDIVEIDAGDTFCYDEVGYQDKRDREVKAAKRIFGILPEEQTKEMWDLWEEFEEMATPESKFAASLDRLQPILNNYFTEGAAWKKHNIKLSQVIKKNGHIKDGAPALWSYVEKLLNSAVEKGYLING